MRRDVPEGRCPRCGGRLCEDLDGTGCMTCGYHTWEYATQQYAGSARLANHRPTLSQPDNCLTCYYCGREDLRSRPAVRRIWCRAAKGFESLVSRRVEHGQTEMRPPDWCPARAVEG